MQAGEPSSLRPCAKRRTRISSFLSRKKVPRTGLLPFVFSLDLCLPQMRYDRTRRLAIPPTCALERTSPACVSAAGNARADFVPPRRRLLIRRVWFSFALQFNPPESRGIFASLHLAARAMRYTVVVVSLRSFRPECLHRSCATCRNDRIIRPERGGFIASNFSN